jgi:signal transduction histidine kinase
MKGSPKRNSGHLRPIAALRGKPRIKSFRVELTLIIFLLMLLTSGFTVGVYAILHAIFPALKNFDTVASSASTLIACTIIGTGAAAILTKWLLIPLKEMIDATERIAKGDFKVHIQESFDKDSDFGSLQRSFNHMAKELDGIEMFRNDFINNFSHEFKTPIVSIQGFAHQLRAGGLTPEEEREYIRIIATESDRLAKMATNILLLSKLENQAIVTEKTEFYLDEQIRTCILLLEKEWAAKDIELNIDLDEVRYCFNEAMLSHVWVNLLGNAIKFTPPRGSVTCTLQATDSQVVFTLSDTGCGMDEFTQKHIFEKFYQGDTSHTGDGNGIGLTVVGRILVLCGGSILVESEPGLGSTFTVTLPVTVTAYEDVTRYEGE